MACFPDCFPTRTIFQINSEFRKKGIFRKENRTQFPGWTKNSSYYSAPVGDRPHDLPSPYKICCDVPSSLMTTVGGSTIPPLGGMRLPAVAICLPPGHVTRDAVIGRLILEVRHAQSP